MEENHSGLLSLDNTIEVPEEEKEIIQQEYPDQLVPSEESMERSNKIMEDWNKLMEQENV